MKLEKTARRKTASRRGAATAISSNYDSLFVHRKNALYRRAAELSAITDCNIGIILLSPEGELSQFSTAPMKKMLRSYAKLCGNPHEIHTMESIQAKCLAQGGDGIGLKVGEKSAIGKRAGGGRGNGNGNKNASLASLVEVAGQEEHDGPWEEEALEAIMSMGARRGSNHVKEGGNLGEGAEEGTDAGTEVSEGGAPGGKRALEEVAGDRIHRLAKMGRAEMGKEGCERGKAEDKDDIEDIDEVDKVGSEANNHDDNVDISDQAS